MSALSRAWSGAPCGHPSRTPTLALPPGAFVLFRFVFFAGSVLPLFFVVPRLVFTLCCSARCALFAGCVRVVCSLSRHAGPFPRLLVPALWLWWFSNEFFRCVLMLGSPRIFPPLVSSHFPDSVGTPRSMPLALQRDLAVAFINTVGAWSACTRRLARSTM